MTQAIVNDYPPLFDEIDAAFKVRGRNVIFSWGDRIYNPMGVTIEPAILNHEAVHGHRQGTREQGIIDWWRRYIEDPAFRLAEEIPAHQAEYLWLACYAPSRNERRAALKQTAERLASPLYGRLVTRSRARRLLDSDQVAAARRAR